MKLTGIIHYPPPDDQIRLEVKGQGHSRPWWRHARECRGFAV